MGTYVANDFRRDRSKIFSVITLIGFGWPFKALKLVNKKLTKIIKSPSQIKNSTEFNNYMELGMIILKNQTYMKLQHCLGLIGYTNLKKMRYEIFFFRFIR